MKNYLFLIILAASFNSWAQNITELTRADSLRGNLTLFRTNYDINYYHLDIKLDIDKKFISGSTQFKFTAKENISRLQFDLFENLNIEKILYKGTELTYKREYNAVFLNFGKPIIKGTKEEFIVYYSGFTTVAKRAPWDGGFVYSKDITGKPWVAVACQGFGASSWWPTKDHQSDEVDSMMISVSVPNGLMNVSNGRLRSVESLKNGYSKYNWFVSYPINNYSVTLNIGDFAHFDDEFIGENGKLTLDYYVLPENLEKAKQQFNADVKPMLKCFEHWFGAFPFYRDGYKLIEAPYLGMEHQSAVAYGNQYKKGYLGHDLSETGLGLKWDYIIIHESGHEWFGNNITSKDIADMWIHEGFTMYSESLFIECNEGKEAGIKYINGVRKSIANDKPVIGPYNVNKEGSGDMYMKGANMLMTIRSIINNDAKWREILRGLNTEFGLKTTTTEEVVNYINLKSGKNLIKIFDQYLRTTEIPTLEYRKSGKKTIYYRWKTSVNNFDMPVQITDGKKQIWINPKTDWKKMKINSGFKPDTTNFYIKTSMLGAVPNVIKLRRNWVLVRTPTPEAAAVGVSTKRLT